jgi:hypothetical protein
LRYVFRGTKSIDIISLIKVLSEKSELPQDGFPVIEPEVQFISDLIGSLVKMVAKVPEARKFPVPHGGVAQEAVSSQIPAEPEVMHLVMIFVEEAIHVVIPVERLKVSHREAAGQMCVRGIEGPVQRYEPGRFIGSVIEQIPIDLGIGKGGIDKRAADIGLTV